MAIPELRAKDTPMRDKVHPLTEGGPSTAIGSGERRAAAKVRGWKPHAPMSATGTKRTWPSPD